MLTLIRSGARVTRERPALTEAHGTEAAGVGGAEAEAAAREAGS
jgi:hypothetical protein